MPTCGRDHQLKSDTNDWAREVLMKSWPVYDILIQQFCVHCRTKASTIDFARKDIKEIRLEQGSRHGQAHLALKFNLLTKVDQLFSALHTLDVFVAVLDELQRKSGDSEIARTRNA